MRSAIIDVGSNTIRTVIYDINGSFRQLHNEKDFTGIISYVVNGYLTADGCEKLRSVLYDMSSMCRLMNCEQMPASLPQLYAASKISKKSGSWLPKNAGLICA